MNSQEIIEQIKTKVSSVVDFVTEEYNETELELGPIKKVHGEGGYDAGSNVIRVFHFIDHGIYLEVRGSYNSYEGYEFDDEWNSFREVYPKEKKITVYE